MHMSLRTILSKAQITEPLDRQSYTVGEPSQSHLTSGYFASQRLMKFEMRQISQSYLISGYFAQRLMKFEMRHPFRNRMGHFPE